MNSSEYRGTLYNNRVSRLVCSWLLLSRWGHDPNGQQNVAVHPLFAGGDHQCNILTPGCVVELEAAQRLQLHPFIEKFPEFRENGRLGALWRNHYMGRLDGNRCCQYL